MRINLLHFNDVVFQAILIYNSKGKIFIALDRVTPTQLPVDTLVLTRGANWSIKIFALRFQKVGY